MLRFPTDTTSPEGSDHEEEMEYEEHDEYVVITIRPSGCRRVTYTPTPPLSQLNEDGLRISLDPPWSLGRVIKFFTQVAKLAYLKFRRDVDQFSAEHDSMDSCFCANV